jgi:hypothetical protein
MATIATTPFVLVDAIMTVGTDDYQTSVSGVMFEPSSSTVTWQGLTPASAFSGQTSATWTCKIKYAQDWKTANSLAQYLLAQTGTNKQAVFKPQGATTGNPIFTATIMIVPGPIGGDVNTVQVAEVTLGVIGVPVKTAAP